MRAKGGVGCFCVLSAESADGVLRRIVAVDRGAPLVAVEGALLFGGLLALGRALFGDFVAMGVLVAADARVEGHFDVTEILGVQENAHAPALSERRERRAQTPGQCDDFLRRRAGKHSDCQDPAGTEVAGETVGTIVHE